MAGIFKISEAATIALHTMVILAANREKLLQTSEIASVLRASEAHLSKVMQRLVKAGLVVSTRGPKGGFTLAKDPGEISLLEVFETIDGQLQEDYCLLGFPIISRNKCIFGKLLGDLTRQAREYLEKTRISQLAERFECLRERA